MEERSFYWLPRAHGGLCVTERSVFLRGSKDHWVWTQQHPKLGEEAYHIILTGGTPNAPIGDVRSFDFSAHLHRLEAAAMDAQAVELVFYSGWRFSMPPEQYRTDMERLFLGIRHNPAYPVSAGERGETDPCYYAGAPLSKGMDAPKGACRPAAQSDRRWIGPMAKKSFYEVGSYTGDLQEGIDFFIRRQMQYLGENANFKPFLNTPHQGTGTAVEREQGGREENFYGTASSGQSLGRAWGADPSADQGH